MSTPALDRLCEWYGVAGEYHRIDGTRHAVSDASRRQLLKALGVACEDEAAAAASLDAAVTRQWRRRLPPVCALREGDRSLSLTLTLPSAERDVPLLWRLSEESGRVRQDEIQPAMLAASEERAVDGAPWIAVTLTLPMPEATGYHRLELLSAADPGHALAECRVIFAPAGCHRPEAFTTGQGLWGLTVQLYGLRSQRNWGIGDFTDLMRLVEFAADHGADFVGLNPLHVPPGDADVEASPYNPSTRRFLNPLYLDVEAIPEFASSASAQRQVADPQLQAALKSLRGADLIDYPAVAGIKFRLLRVLYAEFRDRHLSADTERARDFRAFRKERGEPLRRYALFEALREHVRARNASAWGWPVWPETLRDVSSAAVAAFGAAHEERLDFFAYLQWNAAAQLEAAVRRAGERGMQLGLYADLALSAKWGGADSWADREYLVDGAHLGAPPDDFNLKGQDWGLPPWQPEALRDAGYAPLIEILRANMRHGGALRIDHVMSLLRCYWIPAGGSPEDGTYVYYRFDELKAILALESRRHRCVIIGEDLGTVPDVVRDGLRAIGALGYRVFYFEKDAKGAIKPPADVETEALTVVSTHDLPTLTGFWIGRDLEWRTDLDLFPGDALREEQIVARAEDRAKLLVALEKQDLLPDESASIEPQHPPIMTAALRAAFHAYVARAPSRLVGIQAEDLLGESEQANLPGTLEEHPNWRRRLSLTLESWGERADVLAVLAAVSAERPKRKTRPAPRGTPALSHRARIPRATYRLQLHAGFGFDAATGQLPYLAALGISHCYCSPYLKARPGSTHGYDIVDHSALNPEIGDEDEFERFCAALAAHDMGQLLDMVPNHMAVMGRDNSWWLDVLENGPASRFAAYFDIDWNPLKEELRGKVLLPVLGDSYGSVLDRGELRLDFDAADGGLAVDYFEHRFPIDPREYGRVLSPDIEQLRHRLGEDDPALVRLESLITAFGKLPPRYLTDEHNRAERARDEVLLKSRLAVLVREAPDIRHYLDDCLRAFNGDDNYAADASRMHALLEAQAYRLAYWRVASEDINYRRFFDINELASLRMENPDVFEATHGFVLDLIGQAKLQGLRIDHPDGLYDPRGYFERLQARAAEALGGAAPAAGEPALYVLAEKILGRDERLRDDWPVHGTTGYDFINQVDRFFVDAAGSAELEAIYFDFVGRRVEYTDVLYRSKKLIMQTALVSELNVLASELDRIAEQDPHTRDFGWGGLQGALLETIACFPVYRTYIVDEEVSASDEAIIDRAIDSAKRVSEAADTTVFEFLRDALLLRSARGREDALRARLSRFVMQLQQYTAPVAAKGMEDTAFYRYGRLLSLNEVGGTPDRPSLPAPDFHAANEVRQARWPHSMLASSTHDSKRSEDVRARLNVLSELPAAWRAHVEAWRGVNAAFKTAVDGLVWPDPETEYFLYQTLFGIWPLEPPDDADRADLVDRIASYLCKAAREAKRHTSWINPNEAYERALDRFVRGVLGTGNREFAEDFAAWHGRAAPLGLLNGLAQLVLKLTSPGVPDIYQGNELWRFDLVDPDNRRPVDFARRAHWLNALRRRLDDEGGKTLAADLMTQLADGRIKLYVIWRALSLRREQTALFEQGSYEPLRVRGPGARHVCAFARRAGAQTAVVAVLRGFADLVEPGDWRVDTSRLADTRVELPAGPPGWVDAFTGMSAEPQTDGDASCAAASSVFSILPVALWLASPGALRPGPG